MALWILRARGGASERAAVVQARTARDARLLADERLPGGRWLDTDATSCAPLPAGGAPTVVLATTTNEEN